jgi:hypothetical protein
VDIVDWFDFLSLINYIPNQIKFLPLLCKCKFSLFLFHLAQVSTQFAADVAALPTATNLPAYISFINKYGTHFAKEITMGAKFIIRSEVQKIQKLPKFFTITWNKNYFKKPCPMT